MDALKKVFEAKKAQASLPKSGSQCTHHTIKGQPALVTFVTAGYPTRADTVPIMLAMQEGGADVIELGVPFSDPMVDGPAIQESNTVCSTNSEVLQ